MTKRWNDNMLLEIMKPPPPPSPSSPSLLNEILINRCHSIMELNRIRIENFSNKFLLLSTLFVCITNILKMVSHHFMITSLSLFYNYYYYHGHHQYYQKIVHYYHYQHKKYHYHYQNRTKKPYAAIDDELISRINWKTFKIIIVISILLSTTMIIPFTIANKVTEHGDILLGGLFPIHQKGKWFFFLSLFFSIVCIWFSIFNFMIYSFE